MCNGLHLDDSRRMTVERIQDFGAKLTLALKALNLSRGKLAARVGVDKSLVGRWASGQVMPTGHNLARISEIVGGLKPGFSILAWEQPEGAFAEFFGIAERPEPAQQPAASGAYSLKSRPVSLEETAFSGSAYPGIYAGFREAFANTGALIMEMHMLHMEGPELKFCGHDGFFTHSGHVLLIKGQVYLFGESDTRQDGMMFCVFHGVNGSRAMVLDGIQLSVAADKYFTPAAIKMVMLRIADLTGDHRVDRARFEAIWPKVTEINTIRTGRSYLPPRYAPAVDNLTGVTRPDGSIDYGLRIPADRSFSISDTELSAFGFPEPDLVKLLVDDTIVPLRRPNSAA